MIPLGLKGLNTDLPASSLSLEYFNAGKNVRPFKGALRPVPRFIDGSGLPAVSTGGAMVNRVGLGPNFRVSSDQPYVLQACQFTPAGSTYRNIVGWCYVGGNAREFRAWTAEDNTVITIPTTDAAGTDLVEGTFKTSNGHSVSTTNLRADMFVFNECLVLNTGTSIPAYLPAQGARIRDFNHDDSADTPSRLEEPLGWIPHINGEAIYCRTLRPFGGRLVAMHLKGANGTYNEKASVIFSSPIKTLGSLKALQWTATTENSVADDIITETPGVIIDGGQLGSNFIVYKSDCVLSYSEINAPPFVVGRVIQSDDGLACTNCWADIGNNQHIVLGNRGVYIHNGENQKQNVSKDKIQDELLEAVHRGGAYGNTQTVPIVEPFVYRNTVEKETWFCVGEPIGAEYNANNIGTRHAYVYAEETDSWYKRDLTAHDAPISGTSARLTYSRTMWMFEEEVGGELNTWAVNYHSPYLYKLSEDGFAFPGEYKATNGSALSLYASNFQNLAIRRKGYGVRFNDKTLDSIPTVKTMTASYPVCKKPISMAVTVSEKLNPGDNQKFSKGSSSVPLTGTEIDSDLVPKTHSPEVDHKLDFRETGRYFDLVLEPVMLEEQSVPVAVESNSTDTTIQITAPSPDDASTDYGLTLPAIGAPMYVNGSTEVLGFGRVTKNPDDGVYIVVVRGANLTTAATITVGTTIHWQAEHGDFALTGAEFEVKPRGKR